MGNSKKTSAPVATKAAKVLSDPRSSDLQKQLAGAALSQRAAGKQTGAVLEDVASKALQSKHTSDLTKELAASVLTQSVKGR